MLEIYSSVKNLIKFDSVRIDNNVFRLHYRATTLVLILFSLLVTAKQYIGDPIDCMIDGIDAEDMPPYDTYCWIHTTYTVPSADSMKVGEQVAHPGIITVKDGEEVKHHKYYQWVCFFLFLQAAMFYIPRYLWKTWEGGMCNSLVQGLTDPLYDDEKTLKTRLNLLVDYFWHGMGHQNSYAYRFFMCETLNLANVVGQIYFTDLFLGYEFTSYGADLFDMVLRPYAERIDPMARVFPKITKCNFYSYGPGGTVQIRDALCVLSLNIINEKIYVFLFFWLMAVTVVTCLGALFRCFTILSSSFRSYLLRARASLTPLRDVETVLHRSTFGDWFLICQIGHNMDPIAFKLFLQDLARKICGKEVLDD